MTEETYDPIYLRGIEEFNQRRYFESHETWEGLWMVERGPARRFYQGLIQAAVALHHLGRGNVHGARKLVARSSAHLRPYRSQYLGLDVDTFLSELRRCMLSSHSEGEAEGGSHTLLIEVPVIRLRISPPR